MLIIYQNFCLIICLERGKYVAIDLSGKNLRILLLNINDENKEPNVVINNFIVSNAVMKGTGEQVCFVNLTDVILFIT